MEITNIQTIDLDYALLTLSTFGDIRCEHFLEYPDLKMQALLSKDVAELRKQNIAGYALCIYKSPVWVMDSMRGLDAAGKQALMEYVKYNLNDNYTKTEKKIQETARNDED